MSAHFKAVDRETIYLFPPSVQDWLPERHLARFVVDVVSKLDLHELKMPCTGVGSEAFNPEMLLALLFYGYATGIFSSRELEQATYDSIAFRYIAANTHSDHGTIASFRQRFLEPLKPLFLQILLLAKALAAGEEQDKDPGECLEAQRLKLGHATELEQQLKEEVGRLMAMAEAADVEVPEGMDIPVEPVFGISKAVLGFRQFRLRGLKAVSGEWTLVSIAWNLKRMFSLEQQKPQAPKGLKDAQADS